MNFKLLSIFMLQICLSGLVQSRTRNSTIRAKSRALHHFYSNCMLNKYMDQEFKLGMQYLNASIFMFHDRVALKGFGKMFKHFYNKQLDYVDEIRKYIIMRGGNVETPHFISGSVINRVNHFQNESSILYKFLENEKQSNLELLEVRQTSFDHDFEIQCQQAFGKFIRYYSPDNNQIDPATANFLDDAFTSNKINRIKYLADLFRQVNRMDQHPRLDSGPIHHLNPIGVYTIDQELYSKF